MKTYVLIDRSIMVVALISAVGFLLGGEMEAAGAAITIWPISRVMISVLDVFFMFFTERPLLRSNVPANEVERISF